MKKAKKLVAALLTTVLSVSALTACGGSTEAATWEDQLGNKGTIRVGISPNYPPYDFYDEAGNVVGYDADFAAYMSDYLDYDVELIAMDFNSIIASLDSGTIDLGISCFSYKEDRNVEWSESYLDTTQAILVRADSGIETPEDLAGKKISAGLGNVGVDLCNEFQAEYDNIEVIIGDETGVSVETVKSGAIDAYIAERGVCEAYANASDGKLVVMEGDYYPDSIYVVAKKGNTTLIDKVNEVVQAFRADEETSNEIFMKWFS